MADNAKPHTHIVYDSRRGDVYPSDLDAGRAYHEHRPVKRTPLPGATRAVSYTHWTPAEVAYLRREWGEVSLGTLAHNLHRSPHAIVKKARQFGLKAEQARQGLESLPAFAARVGCDRDTVVRSAAVLGIVLGRMPRVATVRTNWKNHRPSSYIAIGHDEGERLIDHICALGGRRNRVPGNLGAAAWGGLRKDGQPKPTCCIDCGTSERPYCSRGRCKACNEKTPDVVARKAAYYQRRRTQRATP